MQLYIIMHLKTEQSGSLGVISGEVINSVKLLINDSIVINKIFAH